jgi:hypothetical protein
MMQYLKTEALVVHPEEFALVLNYEISMFEKWSEKETERKKNADTGKMEVSEKEIYQPAIRLNVTSDFRPRMWLPIIEAHPDTNFYDYTKLNGNPVAPNHHLTYSSTGFGQVIDGEKISHKTNNWNAMRGRMDRGDNVAMAFSSKSALPDFVVDEETGTKYQVWDGDNYDARFLDPKPGEEGNLLNRGMIVGLRNKASTLKEKTATKDTDGFFVDYDPKRDDKTVTVPNQSQFGFKMTSPEGRKVIPIAKLSLRAAPDTPEFKRFFGKSKVVDANGKPLVVYHGTKNSFDTFSLNFRRDDQGNDQFGPGYYSSTSATGADAYANGEGANIMPLYVSLQNPIDLDTPAFSRSVVERLMRASPDFDEVIQNFGDVGYLGEAKVVRSAVDGFTNYENALQQLSVLQRDFWPGDPEAFLRSAKKITGRDGVVVDNGGAGNFYIAWTPEQIKSATGNIGTYDATNPDIRYSLRAAPDTPEFKRFFGNSKIVNADGTPKVMYHGTGQDILAFRGKQADAIFLTDDPSFAEKFSKDSAAWMSAHPEEFLSKAELAQGVKDAIAAIRKDYKSRPEGKVMIDSLKAGTYADATAEAQEYLRNTYKGMMPSGPNILPVYVSAQNPFDFANPDHVRAIEAESTYGLPINEIVRGRWETIETPRIQELIKSAGFDGFYVQEGGYKNLAVYNPTQIKSATGNIGTYDVNNPDIRYSLRNIGDEIRSMPNGKDIYDSIKRTTTTRDEKGFIERMMDAISPESVSSLRQKALNRYNQLSVYDKELTKKMGGAALLADVSAEAGALQSDLAAGVTAAALGVHNRKGGIPVFRNGFTTVDTSIKGPTEIFSPLAAMGNPEVYQAYQFWAGAKRGSRFLADGKEELFTQAMVNYAKQLCDVDAKGNVSGKYPEFAKVQKEWTEYNDGLVDYMVDTGVLSKEKANEFKRHGDYIPFYRQLDGEKTVGPNIFQSISGVKPPKALKGSEAPLADFLETVVRNTQAAIQAGMKNTAAQRAVDVAVQIEQAVELKAQSSAPDTVTVLRNGKPVSYQTADHLFIEAVKSLNLPELPFLGILSGPANLLRNLVTKDPGFMLANLMRDSMSAYVTSGANMLPVVDTVKNFGRSLAGVDPAYQALMNAGLLGGYEFSQNIEASGEALAKDLRRKTGTQTGFEKTAKPFTSLWAALEKGTEASDAATRMAVYKDTLARTGNEAEALFRALEVMNFNRKGSSAVVRVLTAAIPFLNARMQGLDVFYRAAFGRMGNQDAAQIQRSFFIRGATMASLSVMYWALTHDDDDYKKQEQETKDGNWLIPSLGIRIPIPFEVGVLFKVIPERLAAYAFGNDTGKDLAKSMGSALRNTFGIAPPQVVLPLLEAKTNYSFYTGRPIIGQGLEGVAPQYQVGANTSPIFGWLGKELGASPMMLEHIYKGYTGSMGMYLVDLMDAIGVVNDNSPKAAKRFEQMPIIKRFALDKEARGTVTSYYELKKEVDQAVRTYNFLERAGQGEDLAEYTRENAKMLMTRDFISSMDKDIKEINEMAMAVRNSPMSPEAKRDALTALNRASSAMTANIQNVRKAVE